MIRLKLTILKLKLLAVVADYRDDLFGSAPSVRHEKI